MQKREGMIASQVESKPIEWLWRDRIPKGMVTVVAGKPDQGKGLFGVHVTADLTRKGKNVLYAAIEDDEAMMSKPRLEAAGADLDRVFLWRFILPEQLRQLEAKIVEHDVRLVILDPLAAALGAGVSRASDSIRRVTNPMSELAETHGVSFVIVEHALKKAKPDDPLGAIGGTGSGLPAAARMAYLFGKDPKDDTSHILAPVKSNLRRKPKALAFEADVKEVSIGEAPYLIYKGETEVDAAQLLTPPDGDQTPGRPPSARAAATAWLTEHLYKAGKPLKAKTVYEDAVQHGALSKSTLDRAAKDLGVIKQPPKGGPGTTWELPPHVIKGIKVAEKNDLKAQMKKGGK